MEVRGEQLGHAQRSMLGHPRPRIVGSLSSLRVVFLGCVPLGSALPDLPPVSSSVSQPALAATVAALSFFGRNPTAVLSVSPTIGEIKSDNSQDKAQ